MSWQSVDRNFRKAELSFRSGRAVAAVREVCPDAEFGYYESSIVNLDECRNDIVKRALADGCDWLFFIDADVVLSEDILAKLLARDLAVVSGVYYKKAYPYPPVNSVWCSDPRHPQGMHEIDLFQRKGSELMVDENDRPLIRKDPIPTDVIGMGCVLIKREVLEKIGYPWFRYTRDRAQGLNTISEDVWFCKRAAEEGYSIYTDPQVQCGHVMTSVLTGDNWTWYVREQRDFSPAYLAFEEEYFEHPNQQAWSRSKKLEQEICSVIKTLGGGHLLDYGCGQGRLAYAALKSGVATEITAYDPSDAALKKAEEWLGKKRIADNPPQQNFDLILCINVLSMIAEQELPEVLSYFSAHGKRVLAVVNTWEDSPRICPAHITLHQRPWWDEKFKAAGMIADEVTQKIVTETTDNQIEYWVYKPCE